MYIFLLGLSLSFPIYNLTVLEIFNFFQLFWLKLQYAAIILKKQKLKLAM